MNINVDVQVFRFCQSVQCLLLEYQAYGDNSNEETITDFEIISKAAKTLNRGLLK